MDTNRRRVDIPSIWFVVLRDVEEVTVRNSEARPEVPVAVQNRKSLGYRSGFAHCSNWSGWIRSPDQVDVWRC